MRRPDRISQAHRRLTGRVMLASALALILALPLRAVAYTHLYYSSTEVENIRHTPDATLKTDDTRASLNAALGDRTALGKDAWTSIEIRYWQHRYDKFPELDNESLGLELGYRKGFGGGWFTRLFASFDDIDYEDIPREARERRLGFTVTRELKPVNLELGYANEDHNAKSPVYDSEANTAHVAVGYALQERSRLSVRYAFTEHQTAVTGRPGDSVLAAAAGARAPDGAFPGNTAYRIDGNTGRTRLGLDIGLAQNLMLQLGYEWTEYELEGIPAFETERISTGLALRY